MGETVVEDAGHATAGQIVAWRRARGLVYDLRWRGVPVAPIYARMAAEFSAAVRSGRYAAWVAAPANGQPPLP